MNCQLRIVNPLHDFLVVFVNGLQVFVQADTEAPHAEIEEQSQRHDDKGHDVEPPPLKRPGVRLDGQHGIVGEMRDDVFVACVAQVFYHRLELVADTLNLIVRLVFEEHLDDIG